MLLNLSISAYEVKTKLSLFERPLTVKKNGVFFFFAKSSLILEIFQLKENK